MAKARSQPVKVAGRGGKPSASAPEVPTVRATGGAKGAPAPTVLVVTPPGWSSASGQRPFAVSLEDLPKATVVSPKPKAARPKLKPKAKPAPAPKVGPGWALAAWLGAAACVVLAALRLGEGAGVSALLGYLVVAGVLVVLALHRPIGRALRRVLAPRGTSRARAKTPRRAAPRARGGTASRLPKP